MLGSHYKRLGVLPKATPEEIRTAYRNLARIHHPDTGAKTSDGRASVEMLEINESWRVLSDPVLRYKYDAELKAFELRAADTRDDDRRSRLQSMTSSAQQQSYQPATFPWRFVLGIVVLGTVAILIFGAFSNPSEPTPVDNVLRVGSCVTVDVNRLEVQEVVCDGLENGVVEQLLPFDATCPYPLTEYRDRQGMGIACVTES